MTTTDLPADLTWVYGPDPTERPAIDALLGLDGSVNPFRIHSTAAARSGLAPDVFDAHIAAARDRWRPTSQIHQFLTAVAESMCAPDSATFAVTSATTLTAQLWAERVPAADRQRFAAGGEAFAQQLPVGAGIRALLEVQCARPDPLNGLAAARTPDGDLLIAANVGNQAEAPRWQGRPMDPQQVLTAAAQITGLAREVTAHTKPGEPTLSIASLYLVLTGEEFYETLQTSIEGFRRNWSRSDPWLASADERSFTLMGALASALGPERTAELAGISTPPARAADHARPPAARRAPRPRHR